MSWRISICMLLIFSTLRADPLTQSREAEAFFDAGDYDASGERYQSLLSEDLSPEQRSLVRYNLATVYLHEGKWVEANELFQDLLKEDSASPLLRRHSAANLSVLLLRQALAMEGTLGSEENPLKKIEQAISLLESAFKWIGVAEEAEQQWRIRQGNAEFLASADLNRTRAAIKTALVQWKQLLTEYKVASLEGLISQLATSLAASRAFLEGVAEGGLSDEELAVYLDREAKLQKRPLSKWGILRSKLQESIEEQQQSNANKADDAEESENFRAALQLVSEGENRHLEARDAMREKRPWLARERLALSDFSLGLISGLAKQQDIVEGMLQYRVRLKDRLQDATSSQGLRDSLTRELATIQGLTIQSLDQVEQKLREREADIEEDRLRIESELRAALLADLRNSVAGEGSNPRVAYQDAIYDWLSYRQFKETEGGILSRLYESLGTLATERLSEVDRTAAAEMLEGELRVLTARLGIRANLAAAEDRDRSQRVQMALQGVLNLPSTDFAARRDGVEEALLLWDPLTLLRQHLDGMQRKYGKILKAPNLDARQAGFLDADYLHLSRWLRRLEEGAIEADILSRLSNSVDVAKNYHDRGSGFVGDGRVRSGRIVLGAANRHLRRAGKSLEAAGTEAPVQILGEMVDLEQGSISINQMIKQIGSSEGNYELLLKILQETQTDAIDLAAEFPKSVELTDSQQRSLEELVGEKPWDEVLPLYREGLKEAELAQALLLLPRAELSRALQNQTEAYRLWEEALRKLKDPSDEGQSDDEDGQGEPDEGEQEESEERSPQDSGIQSVLERLQEMDQDDTFESEQVLPVKRGLRPW